MDGSFPSLIKRTTMKKKFYKKIAYVRL